LFPFTERNSVDLHRRVCRILFCARKEFIRFDPRLIHVNPRLDFPALLLQPATPTIASASKSPLDLLVLGST
jgi:hypothetical protein